MTQVRKLAGTGAAARGDLVTLFLFFAGCGAGGILTSQFSRAVEIGVVVFVSCGLLYILTAGTYVGRHHIVVVNLPVVRAVRTAEVTEILVLRTNVTWIVHGSWWIDRIVLDCGPGRRNVRFDVRPRASQRAVARVALVCTNLWRSEADPLRVSMRYGGESRYGSPVRAVLTVGNPGASWNRVSPERDSLTVRQLNPDEELGEKFTDLSDTRADALAREIVTEFDPNHRTWTELTRRRRADERGLGVEPALLPRMETVAAGVLPHRGSVLALYQSLGLLRIRHRVSARMLLFREPSIRRVSGVLQERGLALALTRSTRMLPDGSLHLGREDVTLLDENYLTRETMLTLKKLAREYGWWTLLSRRLRRTRPENLGLLALFSALSGDVGVSLVIVPLGISSSGVRLRALGSGPDLPLRIVCALVRIETVRSIW
ncbi:hypothetical protein D9V34_01295 [Mycetocola lacteus]|uniref:Uncharacterized protein n=1 Tax=Mycetocola lacteus TaxID=76637 RepID=A0A3L7AKD7_9MICO|nr:hypothetical protein D9V34_13590 [Mycetocola lacteus]RLP84664.1 hypothetical protein D9V34_01295 [Mycetocola lacteus]